MEAVRSCETSENQEDGTLHSHRCENLKSNFFLSVTSRVYVVTAESGCYSKRLYCIVRLTRLTDA
jgi:hypothetical protein